MSALISAPTVADLLQHLDGIPPKRILLDPFPGTAKEKDVITCEARTGRVCELVDGTLVEKAVGYYESRLAAALIHFIELFQDKDNRGMVLGEKGTLKLKPGLIRIPDVSFFFWDRFPDGVLPRGAFLRMTPDWAVEILSPSNTRREMARKRREYFAGGAKLVWEVHPKKRMVTIYTAPDKLKIYKEDDTLTAEEVLPGFSLSIRAWFKRAGKHG